jgi:hypothetical protein
VTHGDLTRWTWNLDIQRLGNLGRIGLAEKRRSA